MLFSEITFGEESFSGLFKQECFMYATLLLFVFVRMDYVGR
jgi:hypothetical protein